LLNALNLLLHELRTPVSVSQGYLRLLLEGRLPDATDREQALMKTMEALGRIGEVCAGASEFANADPPAAPTGYPAEDLVRALDARARATGATVTVLPGRVHGNVRVTHPDRAATAIAGLVHATRRGHPGRPSEILVGVHGPEFVVTSGDDATRRRLVGASRGHTVDRWRGGTGLVVPLAVKYLSETGAHVWTLADDSAAVGVAIPMEFEA
jgi:hypothetical protein